MNVSNQCQVIYKSLPDSLPLLPNGYTFKVYNKYSTQYKQKRQDYTGANKDFAFSYTVGVHRLFKFYSKGTFRQTVSTLNIYR